MYMRTIDGEYISEDFAEKLYVSYDDGNWYVMASMGDEYHLAAYDTKAAAQEALKDLAEELNATT